jgi:hypothetical protein
LVDNLAKTAVAEEDFKELSGWDGSRLEPFFKRYQEEPDLTVGKPDDDSTKSRKEELQMGTDKPSIQKLNKGKKILMQLLYTNYEAKWRKWMISDPVAPTV